jgi:hypothetical protein
MLDIDIVLQTGRSPKYYIEHPGELTIRQLLENYRPPSENRSENPDNVEVWQRPPTADIESRNFLLFKAFIILLSIMKTNIF